MNKFSLETFKKNYAGPDETDVTQMWDRLAKAVNKVEQQDYFNQFRDILDNFKFIPGGRILANLGISGREGTTLYNCFVHQVADIGLKDPDSLKGIYYMLDKQSQILRSEGGYGTNFSWIRPNGSYVKGIATRTPGVLRFMELWDKSSDVMTAGTNKIITDKREGEKNFSRKGAQLGVLSVWHPEILDFIDAKLQPNYLTKFNLSVGITDGFMKALQKDEDWNLEFPDTEYNKYVTEWNGHLDEWKDKRYPTIIHKTIKASELWEKVMKATYERNDPGVLFLDLFNKLNPLYYAEKITACNPCGEIGMSTGTCNLGSLNLVKFIKVDKNNKLYFDFDEYAYTVKWGVRLLDNINDISRVPLPEYKKAIKDKRRIGLGNLGLGSALFMLGLPYGSDESLIFVKKLYKLKTETELIASAELGAEKGNFKLFDKDKYFNSVWWKSLKISKDIKNRIEHIGHMRNSHHSMNAPTGNTSILAGQVSGGIEPVFLKEYIRWSIVSEDEKSKLKLDGLNFPEVSKGEWFETDVFKNVKRGKDEVLKGTFNGTDYEIDKNRGLVKATLVEDYGWSFVKKHYSSKELKALETKGAFKTTDELTADQHLDILSIISSYTNQNNSKTINIPNDYAYEDFKDLYFKAWKSNIKGITTYRKGTMAAVLESVEQQQPNQQAPKRPKKLEADIYTVVVKGERFLLAIGLLDNVPYEIFGGLMSNGLTFTFRERKGFLEKVKRGHYKLIIEDIEIFDFARQFTPAEQGLFRLASALLRHKVPIRFIVEQLQKSTDDMFSIATAAARTLKRYIKDGEPATGTTCPSCNSEHLIYTEGCITCGSCGWSKCN